MNERIGKLERWILIHAYKKIILQDLPENWKYPRYHHIKKDRGQSMMMDSITRDDPWYMFVDGWDEDYGGYEKLGNIIFYSENIFDLMHLTKSEILLNFFDLRLSYKAPADLFNRYRSTFQNWSTINEKFQNTKEYRSALASYSRTKSKMISKKLIQINYCYPMVSLYAESRESKIALHDVQKGLQGKQDELIGLSEPKNYEGIALTIKSESIAERLIVKESTTINIKNNLIQNQF